MRLNIVKQSDVSYGTALHYALDWTYGCNALCGKPMRATARDYEIGHKRVCRSCVKIMAKIVDKAHAEALRDLTFAAGDTVQYTGTHPENDPTTVGVVEVVEGDKLIIRWDDGDVDEMYTGRLVHFTRGDCRISQESAPQAATDRVNAAEIAATLSAAMIEGLTHFHRHGNWGRVTCGTRVALLDRKLVGHSRRGIEPDLITETGFAVLAQLSATEADAAHAEAIEIAKSRLDVADFDEEAVYAQAERTYRVTCEPTHDHPEERQWTVTATSAAAAQERVCAQNNLTWSHIHAGLISTVDVAEQENVDCPPVCEHGHTADEGCVTGTCVAVADSVHPIALEYAEVVAFEQAEADRLAGIYGPGDRTDTIQAMRVLATFVEGTARVTGERRRRYVTLVQKYGKALPPVRVNA